MVTLSLVTLLFGSTLYYGWESPAGVRNHSYLELVLFCVEVALLLWSYLTAVLRGPGFVPRGWRPSDDEVRERFAGSDVLPLRTEPPLKDLLQYCEICGCFKPPRAHHCSDCGRCVLWMDHHCPWTGTCVGHDNMAPFVLFTHYVPLACFHCVVIHAEVPAKLGTLWYRSQMAAFWVVLQHLHTIIGILLCVVALVVMILVGSLAADLHWSLGTNQSMVEELIVDKARDRRNTGGEAQFMFPYDLGERGNWQEVLGRSWWTWWLPLPIRGSPIWPRLRDGSGTFDLSVEQLAQKATKLSRGVPAMTKQAFQATGRCICWYWCGICWRFGCGSCCCAPSCCDRRLSADEGEWMLVTNRDGAWLKAQPLQGGPHGVPEGPSGWLPEACFEEVDESLRYEVPHQVMLQGTWEVQVEVESQAAACGHNGDAAAAPPLKRVHVHGPLARAHYSRLAFPLRPTDDGGVELLGIRLQSLSPDEVQWASGERWRRRRPVSLDQDGGSKAATLRQRRQPAASAGAAAAIEAARKQGNSESGKVAPAEDNSE